MAKVTPKGTSSAAYNPSNSPQACPTIGSSWEAVTKLPPSPNTASCDCMVSNLTCVAKGGLSDDDIEDQFAYLCSPELGNTCRGILANASTGNYGAWSMCSATQRLSWAFNQYYLNQTATNTRNNNPCDFSGTARKVTPKLSDSCRGVVNQAGAAGTGAVTNAPTATGGSGKGSSSSGAANALTIPTFDVALLKMGLYVFTTMAIGAGIVLM